MAWKTVGTDTELEENEVITIRGRDRQIAVFWNGGEPRAVDNRCPHMGFPLDQGSVHDGVLTCHWHHARFALKGGCTFDLFADDIPTFSVREQDGVIEVNDNPDTTPSAAYYRDRLRRGLEQNIGLLQAKGIVGLLKEGVPTLEILRELVEFGTENHETWIDGMNLIGLIARLDPVLSEETRIFGICWASRRLSANCAGRPRRRERGPLGEADEPLERIQQWFREFVIMRHRDGAERALLTAERTSSDAADLQETLGGAIVQRIYLDTGHLYDFVNKALELGDLLSASESDLWSRMLPLLVPEAVSGQGEEDKGAWRNPFDLITMIRSAESELADVTLGKEAPPEGLREILLGNDPQAIVDSLVAALKSQSDPELLAREVALAAAWRLSRFSPSNELGDWFNPAHTFIYANAVVQSLKRAPVAALLPALLHGALAVFQDRFLNVPAGAYPKTGDRSRVEDEPHREQILAAMDQVPDPRTAVAIVVDWVRSGGTIEAITDCLAWAVIREDLDFHKLQVVEGAYQLARDVADTEDRALLFAGAVRHLAAHCPTARATQQSPRHALKLHRGGTPEDGAAEDAAG